VIEDFVEPQLPAEHAEDKFVTERSISRSQMRFICGEKN